MYLPRHQLNRLQSTLPALRSWIESTLEHYEARAVSVAHLGFRRLPEHFPSSLLQSAKIVPVPRIPVPPVERLGLPELAALQPTDVNGITYLDRCFVSDSDPSESLCFHELVHVVQWQSLGVDRFLQLYGVGLLLYGYEDCPLEHTAYWLQQRFDHGALGGDVTGAVHGATEQLWRKVGPLLSGHD